MSAVEAHGLVVRYGPVVAVDGLDLRAEAGQVTAVLGVNGAGKTSTLEALEGYRRPAAGTLRVVGLDPVRQHRALTRRIGVMLQSGGVPPAGRVGEVLRHAAALYDDSLHPGAVAERVGLTGLERRAWRQLSGGEQRRLALGLALVGRPQVVFLDEPTAGVDPHGRRAVRELIASLRDDGTTVVLCTHDLGEVERLADHVVIIHRGRGVAAGTPAELTGGTPATIRFGGPPGLDAAALGAHVGAPVREVTAGEYEVAAEPAPATVAAITAWLAERDLALADLRAGRQRLEDVFLRVTGADPGEVEGSVQGSEPEGPGEGSEPGGPGR